MASLLILLIFLISSLLAVATVNPINSVCRNSTGPCDPQVTALLEVARALGYPSTLAQSWTGNDACSNWVFIVCNQKNVIIVNFRKQKFSGTISPAFANLTSLRGLLLNDNNLTGTIPQILITLPRLQIIDVANNNLSSPIPIFSGFVKFNHNGNPLLANITTGSGLNTSSPSRGESGKPSVSEGMIAEINVIAVVALFVMHGCVICIAQILHEETMMFHPVGLQYWRRTIQTVDRGLRRWQADEGTSTMFEVGDVSTTFRHS